MPYIKRKDRAKFKKFVDSMHALDINTAGELNYLLTQLAHAYLGQFPQGYQTYNDVLGALSGCQFELYRRRVASYEDDKIVENGDVP